MKLNHNCIIKDNLEWIEIGMNGKQKKAKCKVCGSIWVEEEVEE